MTGKLFRHSGESAGSVPNGEAGTDTNEPADVQPPAADTTAQLQIELAAAKADLAQCQDRFLRKAAELENYRKRAEKERTEAAVQAKTSILVEFLAVVDDCERALESLDGAQGVEGVERFREGVRLLYKQIKSVLNRVGVMPIEALGQKFDPHLHEAITRKETSEHEDSTILLELRRGYLFKDRLLRPAQVIVSSRPPAKETAG